MSINNQVNSTYYQALNAEESEKNATNRKKYY